MAQIPYSKLRNQYLKCLQERSFRDIWFAIKPVHFDVDIDNDDVDMLTY